MIITHKICMDLTRRMLQPPIQVMQDDQYSRELEFLLKANGEPWEIPEDFSAMIRWHRESDKVGGSYDLMPDGSLAYSKRENVLTVKLLPQICANPGQVYLTVMMASSNAVAHTFSVTINVCKNPGLQESVPAPEPEIYQQILREYGMMSARVNSLASVKEGSTTGDLELIDGRTDHTGQVHTNIGCHIRKVGGIANDLYGTKTVAISRAGEVAAEAVAMYATSLEVVGSARYLEKVRIPVETTEEGIEITVDLFNSEKMGAPLATARITPDTSEVHYVELQVGRWFAPGEQIVVSVQTVEGLWTLPHPTAQEAISVDWLHDCPGSIGELNENTGERLFDRENVRFVGELIFYDTLREEMSQLQESVNKDPDIHAEFFTFTDDGKLVLKRKYRGATNNKTYDNDISDRGVGEAGSENTKLPKHLIVPEIVDGKAVHSLALAIFRKNLAVESVTLPCTVTEISERCFDGCNNLKNVYGTEHIKVIGSLAFQSTAIGRLKCPNLEQLSGTSTFQNCGRLVYADLGKVTALPAKAFNFCTELTLVKSENRITSVGDRCFYLTANLKNADFIPSLKNIGQVAFLRSGVDYDWASLTGCNFGTDTSYATPMQYNPTDFWSGVSYTPCENPLPTFLSQSDPRWKNWQIGTSGVAYGSGCILMTLMHAYCGLHNIAISSVSEFEQIAGTDWLNAYSNKTADIEQQAKSLGMNVDRYGSLVYDENGNYDNKILKTLYDALAAGKYAIIGYSEPTISGHVVVAYGINEKGEILIADSNTYHMDNQAEATKYALPVSKLMAASHNGQYNLHIVSL